MRKNFPKLSGKNKWLLIIVGTIFWSLTMIKSGLVYSYGAGFWGPNGHDGIWHLALITSLAQGHLEMPIFANHLIKNYHIGFDLLLAIIHRLTFVPVSLLYFQIFPPLCALVIGWLVYHYIFDLTHNPTSAWWATFFTYFGGSWGWLVSLIRTGQTGGESMFWSQQAISTLLNPPYALSLVLLLLALIALKKNHRLGIIVSFGLLGVVKVYAGVIGLAGLCLLAIFKPKLRSAAIGAVLLAALLFFPLNHSSDKLLFWQPGWFLETMMGLSDRFNWPKFYSAMTSYKTGHNYPKAALAYSVALVIFVLGNLGTRVIGFVGLVKSKHSHILFFTSCSLFLGILFPMLFLQSGTPWNTIQFFYYTQFFLGLTAGIFIGQLQFKHLHFYTFILIVLTIPTSLDAMRHYLPSQPPAKISTQELEALKFLAKQPRGVVIAAPIKTNAYAPAPRPLYLYESTAYVAAYSGQPVFIADTVNLNITGYDYSYGLILNDLVFSTHSASEAIAILAANHVKYLYLPEVALKHPYLSPTQLGGTTIFENSQSAIIALP